MLQNLLASYSRLNLPANMEISFLIVENNDEETLNHVIADFKEKVAPLDVIYLIEPVLGIAKARNRVLNYAIDNGYDLLTFADDDERVEPKWLCELVKERDEHDLDILGGHVRFDQPNFRMTFLQTIVWKAVNEKNMGVENRCTKIRNKGQSSKIKIATGSWMARLDFFRRNALRFNDELGQSGGEDWQLWSEAKQLNAKSGWTPHALAYETIPASRLTLKYHYRRSRDHSRAVQLERMQGKNDKNIISILYSALSRFYKIILAIVALPIQREKGLLNIAVNIGSMVGLIEGSWGAKSMRYADVDGH